MTVSSGGVPTPTPQDHECDGTSTCPATDHVDDCVGEALQARWCDEHGQPGLTCSVCAAAGSGVPTPQEPEITEEMVAAAAMVLLYDYDAEHDASHLSLHDFTGQARRILEAALAGRTVVELPEPDDVMAGRAYWRSNAVDYEIATRVDYAGVPVVDDGPRVMNADYAEAHGLAVVAAARESRRLAREARRLASESRKDGEQQ